MRDALVRLLREQRVRLHACPECPVKGACVFVTPGYEPGYCLPEYKLLFASVVQRLRQHPAAGATHSLGETIALLADRVVRERPYGSDPRQSTLPGLRLQVPPQESLKRFLVTASPDRTVPEGGH